MSHSGNFYTATYGNFAAPFLAEIRGETFGEDIGQNSWLTTDEYQRCFSWLQLSAASRVLDVGSGSGGPALFMGRTLGCHVTGLELNQHGVIAASEATQRLGLDSRVRFLVGDASKPLPFGDGLFTAVICIDAINHFRGRLQVLEEWHRVLRPGGRILFTDPVVVTGLVSNEEIALRSSIGYSLFAPPGEDERLMERAGFELLLREDATENIAEVSRRWHDARAQHRGDLIQVEGEAEFEKMQRGMSAVHSLASGRRLSRFVFMAQKPSEA